MNTTLRLLPVVVAVCGIACAQHDETQILDLESIVRNVAIDPSRRVAALSMLQGMGQLDSGVVAEALSAQAASVASAAAAILRHEWRAWPTEVLDAASSSVAASTAVLGELALAPRPLLDVFVVRCATSADPTVRALALAARQDPPTRADAQWLLERCAVTDDSCTTIAVQRIAPVHADSLVGALHAQLVEGAPMARFGEFLDRLSPAGLDQLLGVAASLERTGGSDLYDYLARRGTPAFAERLRAMMDGEIPMEAAMLRRAGALLDTPDRRARAFACFEAAARSPGDERAQQLAMAAFDAALDGNSADPAVVAFAQAGGPRRLRAFAQGKLELAGKAAFGGSWPGATEPSGAGLRLLIAKGFAQRGLSLPVEIDQELRKLLESEVGSSRFRDDATMAAQILARVGGEDCLPILLRASVAHPECARGVVGSLMLRTDPVGAVMLRSMFDDLQAADREAFADASDAAAIALLEQKACGPEDARCDSVFARLAKCSPAMVERLAAACPQLPEPRWRQVLAAFAAGGDAPMAQLGRWLAEAPLEDAVAALRAAHAAATDPELRLAIHECRLRTSDRAELVEAGKKAFGANADADDDFLLAALATMRQPLSPADVDLIAWSMFDAPKLDGREPKRARDPRTRGVFPEVAAVANAILRDPFNGARAFEGAEARVGAAAASGVARRRFLDLWASLQRNSELLHRIAGATANYVLALPAVGDEGEAAASFHAARKAEAAGRHVEAEARYRVAIGKWLRDPSSEPESRIHLGLRSTLEGEDPYAALAAAPHLCRARACADPSAARDALATAREFAGRDLVTLREIDAILGELK